MPPIRVYYASLLFWSWKVKVVVGAVNFSNFPTCAQPFLYAYAPISCDYGDLTLAQVQQTNACLCVNSQFIYDTAQSIFHGCGCSDLMTSGSTLVTNCANTYTPLSVNAAQYAATGDGGSCGDGTMSSSSSPTTFITSTTQSVSPTSSLSSSSSTDDATTMDSSTATTASSSSDSSPDTSSDSSPAATQSSSLPDQDNSGSGGGGSGGGLSKKNQILIGVLIPCIGILIAICAWQCPRH